MLIVLTTERPRGARYVDRLLAAVDAERPSRARCARMVLSDGPWSGHLPAGWLLMEREKTTHAEAVWQALELGALAGDELVLLEDDAVPAPGAVARAVGFPIPFGLALVQFLGAVAGPRAPWGLLRPPAGTGPTLLQALKFSRLGLCELTAAPPSAPAPCVALARAFEDGGLSFADHVPDIFLHDGPVSTYGTPPGAAPDLYQGTTWQGSDWTVASLADLDRQGRYR